MGHDFEQLRQLLEANPGDQAAFDALDAAYSRERRWDALAELCEYRATYGVSGREGGLLLSRAGQIWLDECRNPQRALADFLRALDADPTNREALDRINDYYRSVSDWVALQKVLEKHIQALEAFDDGPATAELRAHCLQQVGELWQQVYLRQDKAIAAYRRAFELDPQNVLALYCAREIYQGVGNFDTAAKLLDLEARAENDPRRRVALYRELAHVRGEQLGDLEGAVVALKRALSVDGQDLDVRGELALLLLRRAPLGGGDEDQIRAADLLTEIAHAVGSDAGLGYCEAALDAWPSHQASLDLFEQLCRETGQLGLLADRYRRLVEPLGDSPLLPDLYRRAGSLAAERGNLQEAIGYFEALSALNDPADREILSGLYQRSGGAYDAAVPPAPPAPENPLGTSSEYDPLDEIRRELDHLILRGQESAAEPLAREILELEPGDQSATTFLERRYRSSENWAGLYQLLVQAAQGRDISVAARLLRLREAAGIAEERLQDLDGAIAAMAQAVAVAPHEPKLRGHLERLYRRADRWDDLLAHYEATLHVTEDRMLHLATLRSMADVYWRQLKDAHEGAQTYERILRLLPHDQPALEALEKIYTSQQMWRQLEDILSRRVATAPAPEAKVELALRLAALCQEQLGAGEDAFAACQEVLSIDPDNIEALERMEAIATASGQWEHLLQTLEYRANLLPMAERAPLLRRAASMAETRLEQYDRAANLWQQVVAANTQDTEAHLSFSEALERAGSPTEALEALRQASDLLAPGENRLRIQRRLGSLLEGQGDGEGAFAVWRSIASRFDDPEALEALVRHYEAEAELELQAETMQRLAQVHPNPVIRREMRLELAKILAGALQEPDRAVAVLEELVSEFDGRDREALEAIREIRRVGKDYAAAAKVTERLVEVTDDISAKTELLMTCANWYRVELNDLEGAIRANERVLELHPDRADVIGALEDLYVLVEDWERLLELTRRRCQAASNLELKRKFLLEGADICEHNVGDNERAWGWFRDLFVLFPESPDVLSIVEKAAERLDMHHQLVGVFGEQARIAESALDQARWWKKIGELYSGPLRDAPRALEAMLRGFALDPDDEGLLEIIDRLALEAKDHARLVSVYDAVIRRSPPPRKHEFRRRLATVFLGPQGDPGLALDQLRIVLLSQEEDEELIEMLEEAAHRSSGWEKLRQAYHERAHESANRGDRIGYFLRCARLVQERLQDPDLAFHYIEEAVRYAAGDEQVLDEAMDLVARLEAGQRESEKGVMWNRLVVLFRELEQAERGNVRQRARYLEWIAFIHATHLGDPRAAFDTWRRAADESPEAPALWDALEHLAAGLNQWEAVAHQYETALEEIVDRETALVLHHRRARVLYDQLNRPLEAAEHYWQIVQGDAADQASRVRLVEIYTEHEKWNDLMLLLEREIASAPPKRQRELRLEIAEIWRYRLGNAYEAIEAYQQVLELWPDDTLARRAIEELEAKQHEGRGLGDDQLEALGLFEEPDVPSFDDDFEELEEKGDSKHDGSPGEPSSQGLPVGPISFSEQENQPFIDADTDSRGFNGFRPDDGTTGDRTESIDVPEVEVDLDHLESPETGQANITAPGGEMPPPPPPPTPTPTPPPPPRMPPPPPRTPPPRTPPPMPPALPMGQDNQRALSPEKGANGADMQSSTASGRVPRRAAPTPPPIPLPREGDDE